MGKQADREGRIEGLMSKDTCLEKDSKIQMKVEVRQAARAVKICIAEEFVR